MPFLILFLWILPFGNKGVEKHLTQLTGSDFVNCKSYVVGLGPDWEKLQKEVLDCAMRAVVEKKPFQFRDYGPPTDSIRITGLIGTREGKVLQYEFSSSTSGNPERGKEYFATRPCPQPNIYRDGRWLRFGCELPEKK
jgi:hypothetical protein